MPTGLCLNNQLNSMHPLSHERVQIFKQREWPYNQKYKVCFCATMLR